MPVVVGAPLNTRHLRFGVVRRIKRNILVMITKLRLRLC